MAASPSHGPFHYSYGELHAEASNGNRHRRATLPELQELFRPSAQNTLASSSQQDRPAHWFEAQLLHYGLPPSKTKGTAFKRLHDAFNSACLVVPTEISTIEKNLKKQWESSQRQAKGKQTATGRVGASGGVQKPGASAPKRKAGAMLASGVPAQLSNGVNINVTVNMAGTLENSTKAPAKKSTKAAIVQEPFKRTKQTARCPGGPPGYQAGSSSAAKPQPKPRAPSQPRVKSEPKVKKEPVKKETPTKVKSEPSSSRTAIPSSQYLSTSTPYYIKDESDDDVSMHSAPHLSPSLNYSPDRTPLGLINGIYNIHCPEVTYQWDVDPRDMNMHIAIDTNQTWGSYDLGQFSGIFRVHSRPWRGSAERLELDYRGLEHGERELTIGYEGWISFLGNGRIQGCLPICGALEFEGVKDEGAGAGKSKTLMKSEWSRYNEDNYGFHGIRL